MVTQMWQGECGSSRFVLTWDLAEKSKQFKSFFLFFFKFLPLSPYSSPHICGRWPGLTDVINFLYVGYILSIDTVIFH